MHLNFPSISCSTCLQHEQDTEAIEPAGLDSFMSKTCCKSCKNTFTEERMVSNEQCAVTVVIWKCLQPPHAAGLSPEKLQNIIWDDVVVFDGSQTEPQDFCTGFFILLTVRE